MAFQLKRLNVVKIVESKSERDALIDQGFKLVEEKKVKKSSDGSSPIDEKKEGQQ